MAGPAMGCTPLTILPRPCRDCPDHRCLLRATTLGRLSDLDGVVHEDADPRRLAAAVRGRNAAILAARAAAGEIDP